MLGFSPQAPIGAIRTLTYVTVSLIGASSLTFTSSGVAGLYTLMSGEATFEFAPAGTLSTLQGFVGGSDFTFDVIGKVTVAGKPIVVTALPDSFTIRASLDDYSTIAAADSYITRGWE